MAISPASPSSIAAVAQVFVDDLDAPVLSDDDAHHLQRVLRVRPGETVIAADGHGGWRSCRSTGGAGVLEIDGPVLSAARLAPAVTIGFVAVKGERPEWVVQKLTEIGVDRIVVMRSARSVVHWDDERAAKAVERLRRVSKEAAAQSRRAWLAEVSGVLTVGQMAKEAAAGSGALGDVALAHPGGSPPTLDTPSVAVGPEGGWDPAELAGFASVGLGPQVLRAETAAVAAGVLLCAIRQGSVAPAP